MTATRASPCDDPVAGPDPIEGVAELIDRSVGAMAAQWTHGIAPDALGTEKDHVAPWRSVWKLLDLSESEARFVLASGGHNGGIVAPPEVAGHHYRRLDHSVGAHHADPDHWLENAATVSGSWWDDWSDWLAERSGAPGAVPPMARTEADLPELGEAPGSYVLQH